MAEHAATSGSLALSRRPLAAARALPKTVVDARPLSAAGRAPGRPVQPAEIAQARVFEGLLRAECAELQELANRTSGSRLQRDDSDDAGPSGDLTQIRARIDEVRDLLQALQERFPHSVPDGNPSPA